MPRKKTTAPDANLFDVRERLSTAPCVPALRLAVKAWRERNYEGVTNTTRELLNFWFYTDHRLPTGHSFRYYDAQREAIETLIYIYEVERVRRRIDLLQRYAVQQKDLRLPPLSDDFARYAIKMATGSGKTKVMALALVWQYFNAIREDDTQYAKTFLILAPNVIVFERLRQDFDAGRIFKTDPLFPRHFQLAWDLECYMRGDAERTSSLGALYLTNIQQFYERPASAKNDEPEELTAVLGPKPQPNKMEITDFDERIARRGGLLLVLNDEAHHTHQEDNQWNTVIRTLHTALTSSPDLQRTVNACHCEESATKQSPETDEIASQSLAMTSSFREDFMTLPNSGARRGGVAAQLDFSATPRYTKGALFAWTISDYPLKQAILDNIVKRPLKGVSQIEEAKSEIARVRYAGFLVAAVERWKEYVENLATLRKKPILFIMLNTTHDAEDIGDWLRTKYPEHFGGDQTLIIHTDRSGEVSKADLDTARDTARRVDEDQSPVNAIVSVLMLREGWDVQNVTVVVGLRPYTAKANILPEQTIGRGLRLMFRGGGLGYQERVDIIGNPAFLKFVEDLEKLENVKFETFELGKDRVKIFTILPDPQKLAADIGIPELTPSLTRKTSLAAEIAALDVRAFRHAPIPIADHFSAADLEKFPYEGIDILTKDVLVRREYTLPAMQTPEEVIGYYAQRIAHNLKLPSQFAALAPKIREFFEHNAFGRSVNVYDPAVIQAMSTDLASFIVCREFEKALRNVLTIQAEPQLLTPTRLLSITPPFPFSRLLVESPKTVFNYAACDNAYERAFAEFLHQAGDVAAFAKLPEQFGFAIQYTDTRVNLRQYYPDFVARLDSGEHWLVETKGREDTDVPLKDAAARQWCANATELTGTTWQYVKVGQQDFEMLHPANFTALRLALE